MFQKLSNSWALAKASAKVLNADKELLIFPAISSIALLLVTATFFVPLALLGGGSVPAEGAGILAYLGLFVFYVVQYTVIFFFNSALVGAAMIRLEGGDPTVGDGLRIAWKHLGSILGYALIAATVGMFLNAAKERSGGIGKLVIGLVGMAWNLATFLVVPVLVTRNVGPIEAIKESAGILKKTWGEQVVGNAGIGFVFFFLFLGTGILFIPAIIIAGSAGSPVLIGAVIATFVLICMGLALVNATLGGIYQAALYRYATVGDAGQFDRNLMNDAFQPKG